MGVFDSGLGGLSVLQAIRRRLPTADIVYVADSGHAPYGERDDQFIHDRSSRIVEFLKSQSADVIVVACNTATAASIAQLRQHWQTLPIIGIEPGVKPAVSASRNGKIGVMATPATLNSRKFRALMADHATQAELVLQPCPGLAGEIEHGDLHSARLRELVRTFCAPMKDAWVDTVVLGCTHYPLVRHLIQHEMGSQVQLIDTADAVAEQTARQAWRRHEDAQKNTRPETSGRVSLYSSGSPDELARICECWLGLKAAAQALPSA